MTVNYRKIEKILREDPVAEDVSLPKWFATALTLEDLEWENLDLTVDDVEWNEIPYDVETQSFSSPLGEIHFAMDSFGDIWLPAHPLAKMFGCENPSEWKYLYAWSVLPLQYFRDSRGARIPFWSDDLAKTLYANETILAYLADRYASDGGNAFKTWINHTVAPAVRRSFPFPSRPHWRPQ